MVFKSFNTYRQLDAMDCGPACLKMVLKFYGREVSLENLKSETQLGTSGVSMLGISETAERYGFHTRSVRITFEQLIDDVPLPCILFWNQYHFVVVTPSASKKKVKVADPSRGLVSYSKDEFLRNWLSVVNGGEAKGVALLLEPREPFYQDENEQSQEIKWSRLFHYASRFKSQIVQVFIGLLVVSMINFLFPFLAQSVVDTGIRNQDIPFIRIILIAQFALFFSQVIVELIRSRILLYISTHVNLSILSDFWIKLMKLPLSFFDAKHTGDILQRIKDHGRIEKFITGTALQTAFSLINLVVFSAVLLNYNASVFGVFLGGATLHLLWIRVFLPHRRALDYRHFDVSSRENLVTMQMIHGMHEIKLNNAEQLKRWEWENIQASLFKLNFKILSLTQYQQTGAFFINQGKNIVITFMVAGLVVEGQITLGAMLAIQYVIGQLNSPAEQLISLSQLSQDSKISMERLNEIHRLDDEEKKHISYSARPILEDDHIVLRNISFAYPGTGNSNVLSGLNVDIPCGKVTAIVGSSGSGKTTILKLLQRFYENYSGEIKIGEANLKYVSPTYWRTISGSVMQDGYIFSDTVERNIAVGDSTIEYDRLVHACRMANILEFIESLPLGFNTKVGAQGTGISSGQRQRILIARAIYKAPQLILFDEATNALDVNNESRIMENVREFFHGRTMIVVAHRLSTVKNADKIIVLDNGTILEQGNHQDLVSRKGKYFDLIKDQLELEQ